MNTSGNQDRNRWNQGGTTIRTGGGTKLETRVEIKATKAETRAETEAKENGNEAEKKWKSKRNKETNLKGTIRLIGSQNDVLCN